MMQIDILVAGKIKNNSELGILITTYLKRITFFKIKIIEIDDKNLNQAQINKKLFALIKPNAYIMLLDELGDNLSSLEFRYVSDKIFQQYKLLSIIIAGADGFLAEYKLQANKLLSFGKMTLPHKLIRLVLVEQLYRIQTLITGHPYHRK